MNNSDSNRLHAIKVIQKKLLGKKLTYPEIFVLMDEIAKEDLGDVLTTYFVAASFKEGFSPTELYYFTKAMVETGNRLHFKGIVADKHSTGGVSGMRNTMIIVPIVAAAGIRIPSIPSRAITSAAGTADVMEVLAKVEFSASKVEDIVQTVGGCVCWNGKLNIAPADDVIIRVEEPLSFESFDKVIVSIMAKKIAAGVTHLILDIPYGKTMKVHRLVDAEKVIAKFIQLGKKFDMKIVGVPTHVREPGGNGVGPILEARDVLKVLEQTDDRPRALEKSALYFAGTLLDVCFRDMHITKNGFDTARELLQNGSALAKFKEIIHAQEGDNSVTSQSLKLKSKKKDILARHNGSIHEINNYNLNSIAKLLGAPHDIHAGVYLHKKTGDSVTKNEPLLTLYSQNAYHLSEAEETLTSFPIYSFDP